MTQLDPADQPATLLLPQTKHGRYVLDIARSWHWAAFDVNDILQIEREAVTVWLASPAAEQALTDYFGSKPLYKTLTNGVLAALDRAARSAAAAEEKGAE